MRISSVPARRFLISAPFLLSALLAVASAVGCRPFANAGDPCDQVPCAAGLTCSEGICLVPVSLPPPAPPCASVADCEENGSTDGRVCDDGVCGWDDCTLDADCGSRVCENDVCAEREDCVTDGDCKDDGICIDQICRPPCTDDGECGGLLPACVEGRCEQSCFNDVMCLGQLCEEGICVEPACTVDEDCGENEACAGGRCEGYTPCELDAECFDVDFICNDLGRCEELPVCTADTECGPDELCRQDHCRTVQVCTDDDDCLAGDECVDERCAPAPNCRDNSDCGATEVCALLNCVVPDVVEPAAVAVSTAHGTCRAGGEGACRLVLVEGESATFGVGAFDPNGEAVYATTTYGSEDTEVMTVADGVISAVKAGRAQVVLNLGRMSEHRALVVDVVEADPAAQLLVLAVDESTGAPIANASVRMGGSTAVTDNDGRAVFLVAPVADTAGQLGLLVTAPLFRGHYVPVPPTQGALRVALRRPGTTGAVTGARVAIRSSGDETGAVGYGLALGSVESAADATYQRLLGEPFTINAEVPIIGSVPVNAPAAVTLETAIPLVGTPVSKDAAYITTAPGFATVTAFEIRVDDNGFLGGVLGQTADDLALLVTQLADGADVLVAGRNARNPVPLVADVADIDGDGNTSELIPDYNTFPQLEITPTQRPNERIGFSITPTILDARGELFVVAGEHAPGIGFVPTGVLTVDAGVDGAQIRVRPPSAARAHGTRALVVRAVYDDSRESFSTWRGDGFDNDISLTPLMSPPGDALVLDGVPTAGQRTLVIAQVLGATAMRVEAETAAGPVDIVVPLSGAGDNVILPAAFAGDAVVFSRVSAVRLAGATPLLSTLSRYAVGNGPALPLRQAAIGYASR